MSSLSRQKSEKNGRTMQELMAGVAAGTRYIGDDLIRKVSGQDQFELITSLNLTLAKDGGKIKYIENLEKLKKLESLNLSHNAIERIEKIDKLTRLRELNLAFNCLTKIENLESLTVLQVLNLSGNQIEIIPPWFPKKLKALRVFKINKNQLESLDELSKLRSLSNLTELSVIDNPVALLPHYRLYLVFHLRTLQTLDHRTIEFQERQAAHVRFAQEELEKLLGQLDRTQAEYDSLTSAHNKSLQDAEDKDKRQRSLEETTKQLQAKLKDMNNELETKTTLLKKKTSEVTKACEKHYALEQELAFYKIDHKFDSLSRPSPDGSMLSDDSGSAPSESPYIGKSRFRANEHAVEHNVHAKPNVIRYSDVSGSARQSVNGQRQAKLVSTNGRALLSAIDGDSQEMRETKAKVDEELQKKMRAIELLDAKMREQHDELKRVEEKLSQANMELHQVDELMREETAELKRVGELKIRESSMIQLKNDLSERFATLRSAQEEAAELEMSLTNIEQDLVRDETVLGQLHARLRQTSPHDPQHNAIRAEIATRERRLGEAKRQYQALNMALQEKLLTVSCEAEDIERLEEQVPANIRQEAAADVELRQQMKAAVNSLKTHVTRASEKFDESNERLGTAARERVEMSSKIVELEQQSQVVKNQAAEIAYLREHMSNLEETMREVTGVNESLRTQLEESSLKEPSDANLSIKLQTAEEQLRGLKQAMRELQQQREAEKQQHLEALDSEKRKMNHLKHRVRDGDSKDQEMRNMHGQLSELQVANVRLQDQLYATKQNLPQQNNSSIDPNALKRRLEEVTQALKQYRVSGVKNGAVSTASRGTMPDDPIEKVISELQNSVHTELNKNLEDVGHAMRAKDKMERQVAALKDEIVRVQEEERAMAERAIQAVYENERQETELLKDEIRRLENELQKTAAGRNHVPSSRHHQQVGNASEEQTVSDTRSHSGSGLLSRSESGSSSTATGSTWSSSSRWSVRRQDLVNSMTKEERDLFNELQDEIGELRRMLAVQEGNAVPKLEDARRKTRTHQTMIDSRQQTAGSYLQQSSSETSDSASTYDSRVEQLRRARSEVEDLKSRIKRQGSQNRQHASQRDASDALVNELRGVVDEQNNEIERLQMALEHRASQRELNGGHSPASVYHPSTSGPRPTAAYQSTSFGGPSGIGRRSQVDFRTDDVDGQPIDHVNSMGVGEGYYNQNQYFHVLPKNVGITQTNPGHLYRPATAANHPYLDPHHSAGMQLPVAAVPNSYVIPSGVATHHVDSRAYPTAMPSGVLSEFHVNPGFPVNGAHPPGLSSQDVQYMVQPTAASVAPSYQTVFQPDQSSVAHPSVLAGQSHPPKVYVGNASNVVIAPENESETVLACNIPEHHHLEDYVAELQDKNRRLKISGNDTNGRRQVSFAEDSNMRAIHRLQRELSDRQAELEALDLAVERQKEVCRRLSFEEAEVLGELRRSGSAGDLRHAGRMASQITATQRHRGSLLDHANEGFAVERNRLRDELECLEQSLASRQAKLNETNELLLEHQAMLEEIQLETGDARASHEKCEMETAALEERVSVAGTRSLALAAEISQLQDHIDALNQEKAQLNQTLVDISDVISVKDAEFRHVVDKLNDATERLREVQSRLDVVSELELRQLTTGQVQDELTKTREELEQLKAKVSVEHQTLEHVRSELVSGDQDLQLLVDAISKRHAILESLDAQLDSEITKRRQNIETASKENESLLNEKQQLDEEIRKGRSQLERMNMEAKETEDSLRQLKLESADCRSRLRDVEDQLDVRRNELNDLDRRINERRADTDKIALSRDRVSQELETVMAENRIKSSELEQLQAELARERRSVERVSDQRKQLELTVNNLRREKNELEATQNDLNDKITELLRERTAAESLVREQQQTLSRVSTELNRVESTIDESRRKHNTLEGELTQLSSHLGARQVELDGVNSEIDSSRTVLKAVSEERERRGVERDNLYSQINLLDSKTVEMKQVLQSLTLELGHVSSELADCRGELNELNSLLVERKRELSGCEEAIETLKREAEQMQMSKAKFLSLEGRVRNIGEELDRRNRENDQLSSALHRTRLELDQRTTELARETSNLKDQMKSLANKSSRTDDELKARTEELRQVRESAAYDRSNLELSIQSHLARASRLSDELSYIRAINMELNRRLDTQEEIGERETSLVVALHSLKSDLKHEVTENVLEMERSRQMSTELSELQSNNDSLRQCVDDLRQNLHVMADVGPETLSTTSANVNTKDFFADHQELLKMQLRQKMQRHADSINSQKRLSQNTIHNLRCKLTNLEQVLSQTDAAKLAQLENNRRPTSKFPDNGTVDDQTS